MCGESVSFSVGIESISTFYLTLMPFGMMFVGSSMSGRRCSLNRVVSCRPLYYHEERSHGASPLTLGRLVTKISRMPYIVITSTYVAVEGVPHTISLSAVINQSMRVIRATAGCADLHS